MGETFHIAVDMDDVILDFMGGLQRAIETEYNVKVPDFDRWELSEVLDPVLGKSWWKWLRQRDWLWSNFPALPGSIGGLAQLRERGHYLEIVTSKPDWAEYSVWKWMGKWRPPVNAVTIVDANDKNIRKVDMTEADIIVDDKESNVVEFAEEERLGILFSRTHNHAVEVIPGMVRARDWAHVVQLIDLESQGLLEYERELTS